MEPTHSSNRQVVRTRPSERYDLTMVARRVYGDPTETLVVMAAAGLTNIDTELKEQDLVLPTIEYLRYLKQKCGIVTPVRSVR
ncbi:hypothetical protein [Pseudomonas atacamensis]|uniref:hypothetical protein n=1 Tax=Pseudomonas atacamensis TaxID=2565368 RepID=UPI0019D0B157|nr:hypothetical protein [Pseudomonas atacamensis]QSL90519.1 hypothetical protein JWU58_27155 [Pseudomonas atacamensis]